MKKSRAKLAKPGRKKRMRKSKIIVNMIILISASFIISGNNAVDHEDTSRFKREVRSSTHTFGPHTDGIKMAV